MKLPKNRIPKLKDLEHISTDWYGENDKLTRISVYNNGTKVVKKPPVGDPMDEALTKKEFNEFLVTFKSFVEEVRTGFEKLNDRITFLEDRVTNLVEKNDLKE